MINSKLVDTVLTNFLIAVVVFNRKKKNIVLLIIKSAARHCYHHQTKLFRDLKALQGTNGPVEIFLHSLTRGRPDLVILTCGPIQLLAKLNSIDTLLFILYTTKLCSRISVLETLENDFN